MCSCMPKLKIQPKINSTNSTVTALAMARTGSRYRYNVSETNPISPKQIPPASAIDQCDQPRNRISKNGYPQNPYAIKIIVFSIRLKPHHLFFSVPCWAENILSESDISCLGRCVLGNIFVTVRRWFTRATARGEPAQTPKAAAVLSMSSDIRLPCTLRNDIRAVYYVQIHRTPISHRWGMILNLR